MLDFNGAGEQRDYEPRQPSTPEIQQDPVEKFLGRLADFDLAPGVVVPDGKLYRFGKGKVCWYVFHSGDICGAAFGSWKTGLSETWCSKDVSRLTYQERTDYHAKQALIVKAQKAQEAINQDYAKKIANELWNEAKPVAPGGHNYLVKKGLGLSHYLRVGKDDKGRGDMLLIPGLDETGQIWSIQFIDKNGRKRFQPMGKRKGIFLEVPGAPGNNEIIIAEGVATGASIREKSGATVFCSFNDSNMPAVARKMKERHPGKKITIAADNDQFTPGNPGIGYGKEAARAINAPLVYPSFTPEQIETWRHLNGNPDKGPTDFNDLAAFDPAAVVIQLGDASKKDMLPPLTVAGTSMAGRVFKRPQEREVVLTLFGEPLLTRDLVGVLAATGGTGKTFWLLKLAHILATGGSFGPIKAVKKFKVLVICAEDDQEEVDRRLWDICGGVFSENLHAASVYGEVGPLMRVENGHPERAAGFDWLESTLKNHVGFDFVILDPKSRLYGLDENSNDHATAWIGCLEYLCKEYVRNLIFSTHTSQANAGAVSQNMNRGATAIVDGCRWQAGLAQISEDMAKEYDVNARDYIVFDTPKSNYSARQSSPIFFKRTQTGALEYTKLEKPGQTDMIKFFLAGLEFDSNKYTARDLKQDPEGKPMHDYMKKQFPRFKRKEDFGDLINTCLGAGLIKAVKFGSGSGTKDVFEVVEK